MNTKHILPILVLFMLLLSSCSAIQGNRPPLGPTSVAPTATLQPVEATEAAQYATSTPVPTTTPIAVSATQNAVQNTMTSLSFGYDLFDPANGEKFVIDSEPMRGYHRTLEFLYGIRIDKPNNKLVEYEPTSRGTDKNTWPSRVLLVNGNTNRQMNAGEVEARKPIMYRVAPKNGDIAVQWNITLDNVDNPDFNNAYKATSVGKNGSGIFLVSLEGVDVRIRTFDANGVQTDEKFYFVQGKYCDDCYVGTGLTGTEAQYKYDPANFAFDTSNRHVKTTDVLTWYLPPDFKGHWEVTMVVKDDRMAEWFVGALSPNQASASK